MDKWLNKYSSREDLTLPRADKPHPLADERGFSIMEVMIAASLMLVVALGVATMQSSQSKGNKLFASQASNVNLAGAIRTQLSRRATCASSFVVRPANYTGPSEVQVRLGPNATDTLVAANQDLKDWKLRVSSLQVRNFTAYGTANNGNAIYIGDIFLKAQSAELDPGKRVEFKEIPVAHLTFEVSGTNLVACYAGDSYSDTTQQLQTVCNMVTSPNGVPAVWNGTHCVVNDDDPQNTCINQGGAWDGASCIQNGSKVCTSQNNYWDGTNCIVPPNKTCAAQGGSWNGSTCVLPPSTTCQSMGMEWTGSGCVPRQDVACARMGPGYSWNGSVCSPPATNPATACASLGMVWTGSFCQPHLDWLGNSTTGAAGQVVVTCPYPKHPTGGTCLSTWGDFPLNSIYHIGNRSYICSWKVDATSVGQTVVAGAKCL